VHRFYLPRADCQGDELSLTGREAHHALHVLRLRPGDRVTVLDGEGQVLQCNLADSARDRLRLKVLDRQSAPTLPCQITLAQAVPKGKLFEEIIQKATELGAFRIVPLVTQRTVGKFDAQDQKNKLAKWRLVAIEAIKQCGSAWLPHVEPPTTIDQFIAQQKTIELPLVGSLAKGALHPRTYFDSFEAKHGRKPKSISISIGPEGDFTPDELSQLQSAGAHPITLGPLVLRTDTATVYCLSVVNYELSSTAKV
jgi:16S rRNA (uracil1498-N3)-methyltransferase